MNLNDLRNLDPNNIGSWPGLVKGMVLLLICAAVLGAGYYFIVQHQIATLERVQREEGELKQVFETKQRKAANLEPLKQQLAEMKQSFGAMLRLLPDRTEIEGLLVDISQSGLAAGLEFELFKPQNEQPEEFYAVQPINIVVTGTYHEFGEFISAVAALPRIVTQHDIQITPIGGTGPGSATPSADEPTRLRMNMIAKTYRYLDEEEIAAEAQKSKGQKGSRR
ncbi:MAG: type 4a pilus biogenesis protein PilO [Thermoanaerobaculia bacterium]|nr:type 4a pilus biogenesis protein PilO [Thermoanaerobaculia bacterium]